jgi:hypothetical protein
MARPGADHREVSSGDIAIWDAETIKIIVSQVWARE